MTRIANATNYLEEHGGIEVTPEMIEAGANELSFCDSADSWWSIAEDVYRAMEKVRRDRLRCASRHE
jgi:hypothetical protein